MVLKIFKYFIKSNYIIFTIMIMCNLLYQSQSEQQQLEFKDSDYFYYVYENNSVELDCKAIADPKANINWYIYKQDDMKFYIDCNNNRDYECNGYLLKVKNNSKDAKYECEVCNKGVCISVHMQTKNYFNQIRGPSDGVRPNGNVFLECSIRDRVNKLLGLPSSLIWFKHNSKRITKQQSEQLIEQIQYEHQNDVYSAQRESNYNVRKLESSIGDSLLLTFRNVSTNHEGWYTCVTRVYSDDTTFHAKSFYLKVLRNLKTYPTATTISGESNLVVKKTHYFILSCPWNNSYTPNINWHHNDIALNCNKYKRILCTDLSIVIKNVVGSDAGTYKCSSTCNATDCHKTLKEFHVNVNENKKKLYLKIYPENQRAQVKSSVTFRCEIEPDYGDYTIDWLKFTDKKSALITFTNMQFYRTVNVERDRFLKIFNTVGITLLNIQTKTLELSNITVDDEAWYACCFYNEHTQNIRSAYLIVEFPPVFEESSGNQVVHEYQPYTLKCKAMGKPMPKLKWYQNGKEMLDDIGKPYTANEIVKTEANINEAGTYKCIASNTLGSVEHTFLLVVMNSYSSINRHADLKLQLTFSPSVVGLLANNMTIECRINEPIFGTLLWLRIMQQNVTKEILNLIFPFIYVAPEETFQDKYKKLIDTLNITTIEVIKHASKNLQNETMNLVNLSSYDEGWYACIVLESFTKELAYYNMRTGFQCFYLKVVNETLPKFGNISTVKSYEIIASETLKLDCFGTGRPMPDINWYHNGTLLNCNVGRVFCQEFQMILLNVSWNDSGSYNCKLFNNHGYIQHEVEVQVVLSNDVNNSTTIAISATGVALLLICLCIVVYVFVKKDKKNKALLKTMEPTVHKWTKIVLVRWPEIYEPDNECESLTPIIEIKEKKDQPARCAQEEYLYESNEQWEIHRSHIVLGATLGEGYFGRVVMGQSNDLKDNNGSPIEVVAVKILKDNATEMEVRNLVHELEIMKAIGRHINVVCLLGCCSQNGPLWLVMEYAKYGNLKNFLQNYKNNLNEQKSYENTESNSLKTFFINSEQLISFAYQIAQGMDYLASKRCIHRDLAARNILVASGYIMKIADFGLARDLQLSEYYRKDQNHILPVKWMAPEALDKQKFTRATDVWSYGILLWEIMSYGAEPYEDISCIVNLLSFLWHGERLARPENCTDYIYEIMRCCWNINPQQRPSFKEIVCKFRSLIECNLADDNYLELE